MYRSSTTSLKYTQVANSVDLIELPSVIGLFKPTWFKPGGEALYIYPSIEHSMNDNAFRTGAARLSICSEFGAGAAMAKQKGEVL
jgi:hypothetical protein